MPWLKGGAYFTAHRYAEAIASFNQIADPIYEVYGWLAASYAHAGQLDKAHEMLDEFLRGAARDMAAPPGPKLADWKPYWRKVIWYKNEADYEHLFQGLRLAGLPE
jgi:adenylate cyclase